MSCTMLAGVVGGVGVILGAALVALWKGGVRRIDVEQRDSAAMMLTSAGAELERLTAIIAAARRLTGEEAVANMLDRAQR